MGGGQQVRIGDAVFRGLAAFDHHPLGEAAGRLDVGHVVHQVQRLQRRVGAAGAHDARLAGRRVERHHGRRPQGALPERVEAAAVQVVAGLLHIVAVAAFDHVGPQALRLIRLDRRPADLLDEEAGHGQGLVADHRGGQAQPRAARDHPVLRVPLELLGADVGRLAIGGAGHDGPLQGLDVPARVDELGGQPVEQLGVAGELALRAEVLGRLHQAGPEVHLPEPVHGDAGGQGVAGVDEPPRERQPVGLDALGQRRQHCGHAGEHLFGGAVVGAAVQPVGRLAHGPLFHHHHRREAVPQLRAPFLQAGHLAHRRLHGGRRVLVEERQPQLVGLGGGPLPGGEGGDAAERLGLPHHRGLGRGQRAGVDPHLVEMAPEPRLVRPAGADAQGIAGNRQPVADQVEQRVERLQAAVDVDADALRRLRAVVGGDDVLPAAEGDLADGLRGHPVVEHARRQVQADPAVFEIEAPAHLALVAAGRARDDHAVRGRRIHPGG